MGADGAAVNLGHKGGVTALLQADAGDFIISFHCMPHRYAVVVQLCFTKWLLNNACLILPLYFEIGWKHELLFTDIDSYIGYC